MTNSKLDRLLNMTKSNFIGYEDEEYNSLKSELEEQLEFSQAFDEDGWIDIKKWIIEKRIQCGKLIGQTVLQEDKIKELEQQVKELQQKIKRMNELYPKWESIVNAMFLNASIHGMKSTGENAEILIEFAKLMEQTGIKPLTKEREQSEFGEGN